MNRETRIDEGVKSLIGGSWELGQGDGIPLLDKFSREAIASVASVSRKQLDAAVRAISGGFRRAPGPRDRGEVLAKASALIESKRPILAETMRIEAGFTDADSQGEITRCVETLRLCAEEARRMTGGMVPMEGAPGQAGRLGFTLRVPLGIVCAITPFNSPLNTVAHKVGPALAAGNAVILKPSQYTPLTANLLAEALLEAGVPADLLAVVHGGADIGRWLVEEPEIQFFAFTGSTAVGRQIQRQIDLRRSQLELGSIAHTIVDAGSDIARAVPRIVAAAYRKAGQVCTSVQVLLVHRTEYEPILRLLAEQVSKLQYGDPARPGCMVGPLISEAAAVRVQEWINEAIAQKAVRVVGGDRVGSVLAPTLLTDTTPAMKVRREEVFGPVLSIVSFEQFEEAVALVNGTPYGLSVGVFTDSVQHAFTAARALRAGAVHINEASSSRADLMPFGGSKDSGFGREGPAYAVREMTEERLITFATS